MQELIEVIRAAVASDATKEQKAAGAAACRTILTALDTEPGKPLSIPGITPAQTMPRISIDQVLDLMIAKLTMVANEREAKPALAATATTTPAANAPATPTTIAPAASRGFRVPMVPGAALKVARRIRATHPATPRSGRGSVKLIHSAA